MIAAIGVLVVFIAVIGGFLMEKGQIAMPAAAGGAADSGRGCDWNLARSESGAHPQRDSGGA